MWDPTKYLDFADHRARPFFELLARIETENPRRVVDLGCGPGNLTQMLARRWPDAGLDAVDSSPEMVAAARARGLPARQLEVQQWLPTPDTDVVVCNAVLQWVPEHPTLLGKWLGMLPSGGWFAMQVPGNLDAPSHREIRDLAESPRWRHDLEPTRLRQPDAVLEPQTYADILAAGAATVDAWETTYIQRLSGPNPVLEWVTGTALRPIHAALDEPDWQQFRAELGSRLAAIYPPRPDGTTWFPFRRIFAVASAR